MNFHRRRSLKRVLGASRHEATAPLNHRDCDWTEGLKHARNPSHRAVTPLPGTWTATRWDRWRYYLS